MISDSDFQSKHWKRSKNIVIRQMGDSYFLANPSDNEIYYLNEVSTAIWNLLEEPLSGADISSTIQTAFPEANSEAVIADVRKLLSEFAELGLACST